MTTTMTTKPELLATTINSERERFFMYEKHHEPPNADIHDKHAEFH